MKEELARKETEFCNLSHTAAEQKHQTEVSSDHFGCGVVV